MQRANLYSRLFEYNHIVLRYSAIILFVFLFSLDLPAQPEKSIRPDFPVSSSPDYLSDRSSTARLDSIIQSDIYDGIPSSATKSEYSYDVDGILSEYRLYLMPNSEVEYWDPTFKHEYSRNEDGLLAATLEYEWQISQAEWLLDERTVYTYDQGLLIFKKQEAWNSGDQDWHYLSQVAYEYNGSGQLVTKIDNDGFPYPYIRTEYFYDGANHMTQYLVAQWLGDENSGEWIDYTKWNFFYDEYLSHYIMQWYDSDYSQEWMLQLRWEMIYENDAVVELNTFNWIEALNEFTPISKSETEYDPSVAIDDVVWPELHYDQFLLELGLSQWLYNYKVIREQASNWNELGEEWLQNSETIWHYSTIEVLSSEDDFNSKEVNIYPNPSSDLIYVKLPVAWKEIEILDSFGRIVRKGVNDGADYLELDNLDTGTYVYRLTTSDQLYTGKFIIQY